MRGESMKFVIRYEFSISPHSPIVSPLHCVAPLKTTPQPPSKATPDVGSTVFTHPLLQSLGEQNCSEYGTIAESFTCLGPFSTMGGCWEVAKGRESMQIYMASKKACSVGRVKKGKMGGVGWLRKKREELWIRMKMEIELLGPSHSVYRHCNPDKKILVRIWNKLKQRQSLLVGM